MESVRSIVTSICALGADTPHEIDHGDLLVLLESAATVRDENTCLADRIRILEFEHTILVQEQTTEGEVLVRRLASIDEANRLVDDRLRAYERMWDG